MADLSDFYALDELLNDDEQMIRDTVKKFVESEFKPLVAEHFEAGTFPMELVPTIADMGLLGMHLDGYGCAGASAMAYGIACRELEAGDSGLRSFVSVQGSLCMFRYGNTVLRNKKKSGCRKWRQAKLSDALVLLSPTTGLTHRQWLLMPNATAMNGSSMVQSAGLPTQG